jgi:flavin reductase (DIM6/NTAB) family NADH-FMN oxidoreductase RutF
VAPGRSKVLAILVNSVMFFSFSSAMVMIHLNPRTRTYSLVSAGDF